MIRLTKPGRLPRWLTRLLLVVLFCQVTLFFVRPVITYRAVDLGAGEREVGLIVVAQALIPALVAIPLGRYSDQRRPAPVLQAGVAMMALGCVGLAVSWSIAWLTVATCVLGMGSMCAVLGSQMLIGRLSTDGQLDRDFGWTTAAGSIGQMIGPALVGVVISDDVARSVSTTRGFLLGAVICGAVLAICFGYGDTPRRGVRGETRAERSSVLDILRRPGMTGALLVSLAVLTAVDLIGAYLPLLGERRGIPPAAIGLLLSLRAATSFLSRILIPKLLGRWNRSTVLRMNTLGAGALLLLLPMTDHVWLMAVLMLAIGFGLGLGQPLTMGLVAQAVPPAARGAALSIRLTSNKIGQVMVPALVALVTGTAGAGAAFVVLGAVLVGSASTVRDARPPE